jgi:hypothetical protein
VEAGTEQTCLITRQLKNSFCQGMCGASSAKTGSFDEWGNKVR